MLLEQKVNILLVDDQPKNLLALSAILESLDENLVSANSGVEALRYLLQQDFAVIVLDVQMPGMDGFETAELIRQRERSKHTPIIFVTAINRDEIHIQKGYSLGAVDYMMKPFAPEILKSKVAVFVDLFKKRELLKQQTALLEAANKKLSGEIQQRQQAEERLQRAKDSLEIKVEQRTAELAKSMKDAEEARAKAEEANKAKSEFLANMSHELRTPLNAIIGFTQIMNRDSSLPQSQRENLGIIHRSSEHLLDLINNILEMSKIEAGRNTLYVIGFDLYHLLDTLQEMLQLKANEKSLQLIFDRTPDVPQYVKTDESKLRQVLINLLSNAIKFTHEGGVSLRVKVEQGTEANSSIPNFLLFEVEDTGSGIEPDKLDEIFKPFVQTQTGRQSQQGTGLGLAISQAFVHLMGGNIAVSSTLGQGTIFRLNVQIELAEVAEIQTQKPQKRAIGLAPDQPTYRILVVDDRWENRQVMVKLLCPLGFEVKEAENGQEALHLWETWEPHLIWMDMRMPVMDGYQATKQIKATIKGQATAVIALTASAFEEERTIVLSAGCDDFVRKPFREEVIFEKMAEHLGVCYVYEEPLASDSLNSSTPQELTKEALAVMSTSWIKELHQASRCADEDWIERLIQQIPESNATLSNALRHLIDNFRLNQIIHLTQ